MISETLEPADRPNATFALARMVASSALCSTVIGSGQSVFNQMRIRSSTGWPLMSAVRPSSASAYPMVLPSMVVQTNTPRIQGGAR